MTRLGLLLMVAVVGAVATPYVFILAILGPLLARLSGGGVPSVRRSG